MKLDRLSIISQRRELLASKQFAKARELELLFLEENPEDIEFLHLSAWTTKALAMSMLEDSAQLEKKSNENYQKAQDASRDKYIKNVEYIVTQATKYHPLFSKMSEFRYTSLFKEFDVDDVPIWAVHNPVIKEKDDTVDLGHFGRFLVGTTTEVINKRLCRGIFNTSKVSV